jgi:hypothetical protein
MIEKFKVGESVLDLRYGWGIVITEESNNFSPEHCLCVNFERNERTNTYYTYEGKHHTHHFAPLLLTVDEAAKLGYFREKKKIKKKLYSFLTMGSLTGVYWARFTDDVSLITGKDLRTPQFDIEIEI